MSAPPSRPSRGTSRAEALRDLQITPEGENTFYPAVAEAIPERARRSREPEYKPGAMYQCADGKNWLYQPERNYARDGNAGLTARG